jgi:hypothetical protein
MICNLELHRLGVSFDQHGTNTFACANCFLAPIVSVLLSMVMSIVVSFCYHLIHPKHQGTDSQGRLN